MTDQVGATVGEAASGNAIGKDIVHQVVTVGAENEQVATIRLIYELVARLEKKIDRESDERKEVLGALRRDLDELRKILESAQARAVLLSDRHRWTFVAAFAVLFMPVPLYYSQVRDLIGITWHTAMVLAALCYMVSAMLWAQMWWGR